MYKVAYYKGEEIAREEAIEPYINGKFNVEELSKFYSKVGRKISYNNSRVIEFQCCYQK